jgi:hypothetical protein
VTARDTPTTWSRTVDCRSSRRLALRAALAELPRGPIWDLVIEHEDGCPSLDDDGELAWCWCPTLTLRARQVR